MANRSSARVASHAASASHGASAAPAPHAAPPSPVTRTVRAGIGADTTHRAVMPPIHLSTNFVFDAPGVYAKYDYTRTANPTRDLAAEAIAALEGGCGAVVTSSGMSAIAVATRLLSAGDLLLRRPATATVAATASSPPRRTAARIASASPTRGTRSRAGSPADSGRG